MESNPNEEAGLLMSHAYLLLDGSGSMRDPELRTGKQKNRAVAEMVQDLINALKEDDQIQDILLTVICYDGERVDDVRLSAYDVKQSEEYYKQPKSADPRYDAADLDRWDPTRGHGGTTPIGRALEFAHKQAREWVMNAPTGTVNRAIISLLSDGMNYPENEPNGINEKNRIVDFTTSQEEQRQQGGDYKGRIRLSTIGYYQFPEGQNDEETSGRKLLQSLAYPNNLYFETSEAKQIASHLKRTIAA